MNRTLQAPDSETVTHGVRVCAAARYAEEQSDPNSSAYVYIYSIKMTNEGTEPVKLKRRHWIILDAYGERDDVEGAGVVGEYPELQPGESYEYQSCCPLSTSWGTMEGSYAFDRDGVEVEVAIGRFFLVPNAG